MNFSFGFWQAALELALPVNRFWQMLTFFVVA